MKNTCYSVAGSIILSVSQPDCHFEVHYSTSEASHDFRARGGEGGGGGAIQPP